MNREIINTIKAPAAIGPYSHGNKIGDLIFTSGQLPINPETKELITEIKAATRQSLENVKGILEEVGSSMDKVVKATVFALQGIRSSRVIPMPINPAHRPMMKASALNTWDIFPLDAPMARRMPISFFRSNTLI